MSGSQLRKQAFNQLLEAGNVSVDLCVRYDSSDNAIPREREINVDGVWMKEEY